MYSCTFIAPILESDQKCGDKGYLIFGLQFPIVIQLDCQVLARVEVLRISLSLSNGSLHMTLCRVVADYFLTSSFEVSFENMWQLYENVGEMTFDVV